MQSIIEELIRGVGFFALRLVSLGRYRGGGESDRVPEGAIGLCLLMMFAYLAYALR